MAMAPVMASPSPRNSPDVPPQQDVPYSGQQGSPLRFEDREAQDTSAVPGDNRRISTTVPTNNFNFPFSAPARKPVPSRGSTGAVSRLEDPSTGVVNGLEDLRIRESPGQLAQTSNSPGSLPHSRSASGEYYPVQSGEPSNDHGRTAATEAVIPTDHLGRWQTPDPAQSPKVPVTSNFSNGEYSGPLRQSPKYQVAGSRQSSLGSVESGLRSPNVQPQLQYHHQQYLNSSDNLNRTSRIPSQTPNTDSPPSSTAGEQPGPARRLLTPFGNSHGRQSMVRPSSAYSSLSLPDGAPGRTHSPNSIQGSPSARTPSALSRNSPDVRPVSYIDLLNVPYPQQAPDTAPFLNARLQTSVGTNASLLSHKQTLEMYRANAKKTGEPAIQYEFALFMINIAQDFDESEGPQRDHDSPYINKSDPVAAKADLLREARQILQRLSDRSYPFAQYYLGDGYASGLLSKGKPDHDRAFQLFLSASKHGHAEAGYRAALCYEYGWGCRKDPAKAVQFYRQSASKNHPGAMARLGRACLAGDMGLGNRYREGVKWLKRATESADVHYNAAPYELGKLHETGYGADIFADETYAAQLYTKAADLGHPESCYRLGDAYEHGKLGCPRDPALSVHFYNSAAQQGHPQAMMALCAWYMVGAEPVLEKDENEAYEWARRAADLGLAKAEYAAGYFTEMGIGCRRDPLQANVWYVRAADQGDERATNRLAIIQAAAAGEKGVPLNPVGGKKKKALGGNEGEKEEKECIVM
ncbi:MAG: hypothetical protein M1825_002412 [Sarcosagium campestre]|nr:MAG: hypothetical protein M1825_002412 [Sarcosagium campestre]